MPRVTAREHEDRSGAVRRFRGRLGIAGIALATVAGCTPPGSQGPVPDHGREQYSDPVTGAAFRYPPDLGTRYIDVVDWPPQVRLEEGPFTCVAAGAETARAGRTEPVTVGGRTYCVTRVSEGAAGSIYTMYAYAWPEGDSVVILTFSLRAVQCGNYDERKRVECERERAGFSIDSIVHEIAKSVTLPGS